MTLSIIVAVSENNAIGKDNKLLWHLSADLKFFKNTTTGHTMLMGRNTFESIGKALPNRRSIVISSQKNLIIEGCEVAHSIPDALELCKNDEEVFVIGGAKIYEQTVHMCDRIYLTKVHHQFEADTFFPEIKAEEWKEISRTDYQADDKNAYDYSFILLQKVS